jgi:hypothetical protein
MPRQGQYSYSQSQARSAIKIYTENPEKKLAEIAKHIGCKPVHVKRILQRAGLREPRPIRLKTTCHPEENHYAHGLCKRCYLRDYMRSLRGTLRKPIACPVCSNQVFPQFIARKLFCPNCRWSQDI